MINSLSSVPDSITQKALAINFSLDEKARREEMITNKNFYYGKQEDKIFLCTDEVQPHTLNLTRPIVKKRSTMLYKNAPVRTFIGPGESVSYIESLYTSLDINSLLFAADLHAELTGTVLAHPHISPVTNLLSITLYDASDFSVVSNEDDTNIPDAISLVKLVTRLSNRSSKNNPQVEIVIKQQVWQAGSVVVYDGQQLMSSAENPLGFLPFVPLRIEPVLNQYLGHAPTTNIRKLNSTINQLLTDLMYIIKMQGFSPIAISGFASGEAVTIHPGRMFSLPSGAGIQVLSTQPKIQEILDVLKYLQVKCYEASSVPEIAIVGGEGVSGRELLVRFFPLLQVYEEKEVEFKKFELSLANTILRMVGLPELESVQIEFQKDSILPFSSEEDNLEKDIDMAIKTPVDEILRRFPDLTPEEAEKRYLDNIDFNVQVNRRISDAIPTVGVREPLEDQQ